MGYKFSLVLSREITDAETVILQKAGCASAVFTTDSLPTNADVTVTRMDFDDTSSPSLTEAIEFALAAVKEVPDINVPGLTVPAQPAGPQAETEASTEVAEVAIEDKATAKKTSARKRTSAKKASPEPDGDPAIVTANVHAASDLVDAAKSE